MFRRLICRVCMCFCLLIATGQNTTPSTTQQTPDKQIIHTIETLSNQISDLKSKLTANTPKTTQVTHILDNLKKQVTSSFHNLRHIVKYFSSIKTTFQFILEHKEAGKILYHSFFLACLIGLFALSLSFTLNQLLIVYHRGLSNTSYKINFSFILLITAYLSLSLSTIHPALMPLMYLLLGAPIIIYLNSLLIKAVFDIDKLLNYKGIGQAANQLFQFCSYASMTIFAGYFWIAFTGTTTADYTGALQLQAFFWSIGAIWFIWQIKENVNQILLRSILGMRRTISLNIILMWHWLMSIMITLLFITWSTVETTRLYAILKIISTIITIPTVVILIRFLRAFWLRKIKRFAYNKRFLLFSWYKQTKPYMYATAFILQTAVIFRIWNIKITSSLKYILTESTYSTLYSLLWLLGIFKLMQFAIDYFFLIYTNRSREAVRKLLRVTAHTILILFSIIWFFSVLGYDTTWLGASLSFFSVGLAFGVRDTLNDIIAGFLLILDDSFSIGETLVIGEHQGIVEELSVVTLKLRLDSGTLMTFRYGDLKQIGNRSKKYCYSIINTSVTYNTDPEKVIKLIDEAYLNLKNSAVGHKILSTIEIRGVDKVSGTELVIQSRIQTLPNTENVVTRLFNLQLKKLFDRDNIMIP